VIRFIATFALMVLPLSAQAATTFECETKRPNERVFTAIPRFTFTIDRAPDAFRPTAFRLCDAVGAAPFLLVKTLALPENKTPLRPGKSSVRRIDLTDDQHTRLLAMYDAALSANLKDETFGLDGSEWCLDAQRGGNSIKSCFWTPPEQPESRGLMPFRSLGEARWEMADFKGSNGLLM
jgi:hypothetical protein